MTLTEHQTITSGVVYFPNFLGSECDADGSLLVMGRGVQAEWLHCVPKRKRCHEPRANLTFRAP